MIQLTKFLRMEPRWTSLNGSPWVPTQWGGGGLWFNRVARHLIGWCSRQPTSVGMEEREGRRGWKEVGRNRLGRGRVGWKERW